MVWLEEAAKETTTTDRVENLRCICRVVRYMSGNKGNAAHTAGCNAMLRYCHVMTSLCDVAMYCYDVTLDVTMLQCYDVTLRCCNVMLRCYDVTLQYCNVTLQCYFAMLRHYDVAMLQCDVKLRCCDVTMRCCNVAK